MHKFVILLLLQLLPNVGTEIVISEDHTNGEVPFAVPYQQALDELPGGSFQTNVIHVTPNCIGDKQLVFVAWADPALKVTSITIQPAKGKDKPITIKQLAPYCITLASLDDVQFSMTVNGHPLMVNLVPAYPENWIYSHVTSLEPLKVSFTTHNPIVDPSPYACTYVNTTKTRAAIAAQVADASSQEVNRTYTFSLTVSDSITPTAFPMWDVPGHPTYTVACFAQVEIDQHTRFDIPLTWSKQPTMLEWAGYWKFVVVTAGASPLGIPMRPKEYCTTGEPCNQDIYSLDWIQLYGSFVNNTAKPPTSTCKFTPLLPLNATKYPANTTRITNKQFPKMKDSLRIQCTYFCTNVKDPMCEFPVTFHDAIFPENVTAFAFTASGTLPTSNTPIEQEPVSGTAPSVPSAPSAPTPPSPPPIPVGPYSFPGAEVFPELIPYGGVEGKYYECKRTVIFGVTSKGTPLLGWTADFLGTDIPLYNLLCANIFGDAPAVFMTFTHQASKKQCATVAVNFMWNAEGASFRKISVDPDLCVAFVVIIPERNFELVQPALGYEVQESGSNKTSTKSVGITMQPGKSGSVMYQLNNSLDGWDGINMCKERIHPPVGCEPTSTSAQSLNFLHPFTQKNESFTIVKAPKEINGEFLFIGYLSTSTLAKNVTVKGTTMVNIKTCDTIGKNATECAFTSISPDASAKVNFKAITPLQPFMFKNTKLCFNSKVSITTDCKNGFKYNSDGEHNTTWSCMFQQQTHNGVQLNCPPPHSWWNLLGKKLDEQEHGKTNFYNTTCTVTVIYSDIFTEKGQPFSLHYCQDNSVAFPTDPQSIDTTSHIHMDLQLITDPNFPGFHGWFVIVVLVTAGVGVLVCVGTSFVITRKIQNQISEESQMQVP